MTIPKPFFKDVPATGDLHVEQVLEAHHVLLLFICLDDAGNRYLCTCYDTHESQKWLVSPVTNTALIALIRDETTILDAFKTSREPSLQITMDYATRQDAYSRLEPDSHELKELHGQLTALDDYLHIRDSADLTPGQVEEYLEILRKDDKS